MFPNNEQDYIPRNVFNDKFIQISYSQHGEDNYIREFFWEDILKKRSGSYLDIGCFDDCLNSNTKLLSIVGWSGIAVDANPDLIKPWLKARPKDTFINRCICLPQQNKDYVDFYRFKDYPQNSTVNATYAENMIKNGIQLRDKITISSISLTQLSKEIAESNYFNLGLDFLSIDLEYIDYLNEIPSVLQFLMPKLICFEKADPNTCSSNLMQSREVNVLIESGYEPITITGINGVNIIAKQKN